MARKFVGERRGAGSGLETADQKIEHIQKIFPKFKHLMETLFSVPQLYTKSTKSGERIHDKDLAPKVELLLDGDAVLWVKEHLRNTVRHPKTHRYAVIVFDYPNVVSKQWWATKESPQQPVAWGTLYSDFQSILPIVIKLLSKESNGEDVLAFRDHHVNYESVRTLIDALRNNFRPFGGFAERINNPNEHKAGVYHNVYAFSFESKPSEE